MTTAIPGGMSLRACLTSFAALALVCACAPVGSDLDDEPADDRHDAATGMPKIECASGLGTWIAAETWSSEHEEGTVPTELLYTGRNWAGAPLIDAEQIFTGMADMIAGARHQVDLETFEWDPWVFDKAEPWEHDATMVFLDGLVRLEARLRGEIALGETPALPVKVHITLDGRHRNAPSQVGPLAVNKARALHRQLASIALDPSLVEVHVGVHERWAWGGMHSKVLVVDGYQTILTGANHQRFNTLGSSWHDIGYPLKGESAMAMQANFDDTWDESNEVVSCDLGDLESDAKCEVIGTKPLAHHEAVAKPDLDSDSDLVNACTPVFAATRRAYNLSIWEPDPTKTEAPQMAAMKAVMDGAETVLKIQSPNMNAEDAKLRVLDAVKRGVDVRIILSLGFNAAAERSEIGPFYMGGANVDTVVDLYERLADPALCGKLQIRWNSKDGQSPTWVQEAGASHTKYMTADGEVALVGSANQDTLSWYMIRETNVVIDDPKVVAKYDALVFDTDWARAKNTDVIEWARKIRDGEMVSNDKYDLDWLLEGDPVGWATRVTDACAKDGPGT
jgi:phosphatidylserine/phosphatidylglycerophosphate/cardiolipin synthase-like enzyme